jgi:oxygen-dependent protoporphyrinogen oxidase
VKRLAVVGGGISGLTLAYQLKKMGHSATVFEGGSRLGGALHTMRRNGCLMEAGPDSLLVSKPAAIELARELGLELIPSCAIGPPGVVHNDRIYPLPDGFRLLAPTKLLPFALTPLLSVRGKLRAGLEWTVPASQVSEDESLANFVTRRFGREVLETLAQPLIGGIYAADPSRLSVLATLPLFRQLEASCGSITAGMLAQTKRANGARGESLFVTPRHGMGSLVKALAQNLDDLRLQSPVQAITPSRGGWEVDVHGHREVFDGVILACSAPQLSRLTAFDPELSQALGRITSTTTVTIQFVFAKHQVRHELLGSGFVVPHVEGKAITACTYSHLKYEGRAPRGKALLRCHLGNAMNQAVVMRADCEIVDLALRELRPLLGLIGEPQACVLTRHWEVLPQYDVGHMDLVDRIEQRLAIHPGLDLAGNGLKGVGVGDCVKQAKAIAALQVGA